MVLVALGEDEKREYVVQVDKFNKIATFFALFYYWGDPVSSKRAGI